MGLNENYWDLKESKGLGYLTVNEWGWVSYEEYGGGGGCYPP